MLFDVPFDYDSFKTAVYHVLAQYRVSHVYHCDDVFPDECVFDIYDSFKGLVGKIELRKLGEITRFTIDLPPEKWRLVVTGLQVAGVPFKPREHALYLGSKKTKQHKIELDTELPAANINQKAGDNANQFGIVGRDVNMFNITINQPDSPSAADQSLSNGNEPVTIKSLQAALSVAKRALAVLEEQAAGYTSLTIPVHLKIELEDKRKEVQDLESKINEISKRISSLAQSTDATC